MLLLMAGCRKGPTEGYEPKGRARILVGDDSPADVGARIFKVSARQGLRADQGPFTRSGRPVFNARLKVGQDSFFQIDNFLNQDTFVLNAYSHEPTVTWRTKWQRLIEALKEEFGHERVQVLSDPIEGG